MATIYLSADIGNDSTGTGAIGAPYKTFAKALTVYAADDTIYFLNSVAAYTFAVASISKSCTITGESKEGAVLDANGAGGGWQTINGTISISNITFYNAFMGSTYRGCVAISSNTSDTTVTITNCDFKGITYGGNLLNGVIGNLAIGANTTANLTFHRCRFYDLTHTTTNSAFMSLRTGVSTATYHLTMTECTADITPQALGYFYYLDNSANGTVTQTIKNCIFAVRSGSMDWRNIFGSSTFTCTYTCIYGVTSVHSGITSQTGVTQVDPEMVDPDNFVFNLDVGSPLIGAGN